MHDKIHLILAVTTLLSTGCVTDWSPDDDADTSVDTASDTTHTDTTPSDTTPADTTPPDVSDTTGEDTEPRCGDGNPDDGEECDDGNETNGDGCDNDCNYSCESDDECLDDAICNGEEFCSMETHACEAGSPLPDGHVIAEGDPRLICLDGDTVESVCGDGYVDGRDNGGTEECDDGNEVGGDGCNALCIADHACVVALEGGSPAIMSSVGIHPDGTIVMGDTATLSGDHMPYERLPGSVTSCGRHVWAALFDSGEIQHVGMRFDGFLDPDSSLGASQVMGMTCRSSPDLLFAMSHDGALGIGISAYQYDSTGALTLADAMSLSFGTGSGTELDLRKMQLLRHPVSRHLWVIATWEDMMMFDGGMDAARLSHSPAGDLTLQEGPRAIDRQVYVGSWSFNPEATMLAMPGYSGGCFGWFDLVAGDGLPGYDTSSSICSDFVSNGYRVGLREGQASFYLSKSGVHDVFVGEIESGVINDKGSWIGAGPAGHFQLLYEDTVLVHLSEDGGIATFLTSTDGTVLTPVANDSLTGGWLYSSTVLRCTI